MKAQVYKAQRRTIHIGDIPLEVAMLPDGSYRLSYVQTSEVVNKSRNSMLRFCRSKYLKSLLGEDFECYTSTEEISIEGANRAIIPVTFEMACLYWQKCATEGNSKARALVIALLKRSLYDLADEAFEIRRSSQERDHLLAEDLSDAGVARIEAMRQSLNQQLSNSDSESLTERELKLKIQLLQLELERERLQQCACNNGLAVKDVNKIGTVSWEVVNWVRNTLDSLVN